MARGKGWSGRQRVEWPTVFLAAAIYGGWLALTYWQAMLPVYFVMPLGAWLIAWQGSLQHEVLHGHPTRNRAINTALGFPPLSLWLPFERYRASHLAHHADARLTDPLDDPESEYWTEEAWRRLGPAGRLAAWLNATMLGRLLIGPIWSIGRFLVVEGQRMVRGDRAVRDIWLVHLAGVAIVATWVTSICGMPLWQYVVEFVLPGTSLLLIRSLAEHRAAADPRHRTAIVERAPILGLLFLYNNLHVVHHEWPRLPWYAIPQRFAANRERFLAENGGLLYRGYREVFSRYLLWPQDCLVHPFRRARLSQPLGHTVPDTVIRQSP
jgi:fatty acid desaturase